MALPTYNISTEMFTTNFANVTFAGQDIIISILVTLIAIAVITRNTKKWGYVAYPVNLLFHKIGIESPMMLQLILGIYLLYSILGTSGLSRVVNSVGKSIKGSKEIFTDAYEKATPLKQFQKMLKAREIDYYKTGETGQLQASQKSFDNLKRLGLTTKEAIDSSINVGKKDNKVGKMLNEQLQLLKQKERFNKKSTKEVRKTQETGFIKREMERIANDIRYITKKLNDEKNYPSHNTFQIVENLNHELQNKKYDFANLMLKLNKEER